MNDVRSTPSPFGWNVYAESTYRCREADELGAEVEEPLFPPMPTFMASAEEA